MIQVLNDGYVKLIESWGSDQSIIEAARMSTGKGFNGWGTPETPGDEKLLRYLYTHKHSTPFEMAGLTVEVKAPIFVFREWHRHRTQCLAGSSVIQCVALRGTIQGKTIKYIYDAKCSGEVQHQNLRTLNEKTGLIEKLPMKDVWQSGIKPVFAVETMNGKKCIASENHRFLTRRGWKRLYELRETDQVANITTKLGVKWSKLRHTPRQCGEEMTYDIEVDGPNHNFIADGLVVHNSYSEASARYIALPDDNYSPDLSNLMERAQVSMSSTNRQAQGSGEVLTEEKARDWLNKLDAAYKHAQKVYEHGIAIGIPKELARLPVPVARYSRMRASANLRNWLGFLTLRQAQAAQYEIRVCANAVGKIISELFPRTWELFSEQSQ